MDRQIPGQPPPMVVLQITQEERAAAAIILVVVVFVFVFVVMVIITMMMMDQTITPNMMASGRDANFLSHQQHDQQHQQHDQQHQQHDQQHQQHRLSLEVEALLSECRFDIPSSCRRWVQRLQEALGSSNPAATDSDMHLQLLPNWSVTKGPLFTLDCALVVPNSFWNPKKDYLRHVFCQASVTLKVLVVVGFVVIVVMLLLCCCYVVIIFEFFDFF
jgi:hypothetical protein